MNKLFELNMGTGTALGVTIASLIAFVVSLITGDDTVWTWAVPLGIAVGAAIGAGGDNQRKQEASQKENGGGK